MATAAPMETETGTGMATFKCAVNAGALDLGNLAAHLQALAAAGIDEVYCGVRDGIFEGPHTGGIDLVKAIRGCSALPIHVHLMCERPERWTEAYVAAGAGCVTVHAETCVHDHRALTQLRAAGVGAGIAVMPGTSLTAVDYLLPEADRLLLRTGYPEAADVRLGGKAAERVRILKENIAYHEYRCGIEVEGGIDAESAARYIHFGAGSVVLGGNALPADGAGDWSRALAAFKGAVDAAKQVV